MKKLNDEQRKLIEDNYSLIWHLHEKYFTKFTDFDTYMDLDRMAICKAALKWDESKGAFGTFFRWVLQTEINQYYTKWYRPTEKMNRNAESLDTPLAGYEPEDDITIGTTLMSKDNVEDEVLTKVHFQNEFDKLAPRNKKIITLKQKGLTQRQIASQLGITHQWVSQNIVQFKKALCG